VTTFELRQSDVAVLQAATVQITASVSSCSTTGATLTTIHDGVQACVLDGESSSVSFHSFSR
jgi:hypothetical protein